MEEKDIKKIVFSEDFREIREGDLVRMVLHNDMWRKVIKLKENKFGEVDIITLSEGSKFEGIRLDIYNSLNGSEPLVSFEVDTKEIRDFSEGYSLLIELVSNLKSNASDYVKTLLSIDPLYLYSKE